MKWGFAFALGLAVGLVAMTGSTPSSAQDQSRPAYLVAEVNVTDQEGFSDYAAKATETVAQYGGTFIAIDDAPRSIEGEPPSGNIVLIRFPSIDQARVWLDSPEYSEVKGIRHRTADTRQILVQGLPAAE